MLSPNPFCSRAVECFNVLTGQWLKGIADYPVETSGTGCASLVPDLYQEKEVPQDDDDGDDDDASS